MSLTAEVHLVAFGCGSAADHVEGALYQDGGFAIREKPGVE
jgi:hypothetical protein